MELETHQRKKPRHGGAGAKSIAANTGSDILIKHPNSFVHMPCLWENNNFFARCSFNVKALATNLSFKAMNNRRSIPSFIAYCAPRMTHFACTSKLAKKPDWHIVTSVHMHRIHSPKATMYFHEVLAKSRKLPTAIVRKPVDNHVDSSPSL